MKKTLIFLMSITAFSNTFANSFWGRSSIPLNPRITYQQGLDMAEFQENFSQTTSELRNAYVREAISLMEAGALGMEAMEMVLKFDDRVYDRRQVAKKGMGETIANYVRNGIELLNEAYENEGGTRKLNWSSYESKFDMHVLWGVRPGAGVYAVLRVINKETGISRSYAARGSALQMNVVGYALASQLFNSVHRTTFPLKATLGRETVTISGIRTFQTAGNVHYRTMLKQVSKYCEARGERLPSTSELTSLFARGLYHGGLSMGLKTEWAAKNYGYEYNVVSSQWPSGLSMALENYPYSRTLTYICVK